MSHPHDHEIVPLAPRHLSGVVAVFSQSFPETLLAALGPDFLRELLASYIDLPGACGYVCLDGEEVVGFVVGSEDSGRHRRTLMRQRWVPLLFCVLQRLVTSPQVAGSLARYIRFRLPSVPPSLGPREDADLIPPASLTLVAVAPEHRRRGIADQLTRTFLREMASRGADRVKLAVVATNEAALALYAKQGWRMAGRYRSSEGRLACRLIYDLSRPASEDDAA